MKSARELARRRTIPDSLPTSWREQAKLFREHAEESLAIAYERCADQLDAVLAEADDEALTLREASLEGGYSIDHLRRRIRDGTIPNAGDERKYRIFRRDMPKKPGHRVATPRPLAASSRTQAARAVVTREE